MATLCHIMEEPLYQQIMDELKKRRETSVLVETILSDIYAHGTLAGMVRAVIEISYNRGWMDASVQAGVKARH